ncbi:MAG: hypothetical protein ACOC2Y_04280 [Spirochaetota bacterium]
MYQIYLLSILTLVLASITLGFSELDERLRVSSFFSESVFKSPGFAFGLGITTLLVGFFQFLSVHPDDTIILGNLVPAATGMVLGATLILAYYKEKSTVESGFVERLDQLFLQRSASLAYLGLLVAILHFFFHRVLFL